MADGKLMAGVKRHVVDDGVLGFERVLQNLSDDSRSVKERVHGYVCFQELVKQSDGETKRMNALQMIHPNIRLLCSFIQRDIVFCNEDISSAALRVLGFLLHRKSFVAMLPDDEACKFLLTLLALITTTTKKVICSLGLWCLAMQEMKTSLVSLHLKMIVAVLVHGIDNPMGSIAITYEAFQAVMRLVNQLPDEMRNLSWIWVPPVYQKLLNSNMKIVELAESCLSGTKSVLLPPLPRLSEVVLVDIQDRLLLRMDEMIKLDGRSSCTAIKAWGWLVKLLGVKSSEEKPLINVMLKLLETSFVNPSTQVRSASQVAWVSVIDAFVPSPGETGANGSPGAVATPSVGVPLSLKRLKLLLIPLLNTMSSDKDMSVQRRCCTTWIYLLCKLGQSVNEELIFDAAVLPMLEIVFKLNKKSIDGSVWQTCVDVLTDAIFRNTLHETSLDGETPYSKGGRQSPKTPAGITYTGVLSESHHRNIGWGPWHLDRIGSFVNLVNLLWKSSLHQCHEVKSEDGHATSLIDSLETTRECWKLLVRGVEAEGRNTIRPSSDHVAAVHLLLKFVSDVCAELKSVKLLPHAWTLMEILIDGLSFNVLASSFYRIRLQFAEQVAVMPETYRDGVQYADSSLPDMVTPVVYVSAAWFKLIFESSSGGQTESMCMQQVEKLITTGRAGFDVMGNYRGFVWILDHLAKANYLQRGESPDRTKASRETSECEPLTGQNWHFLMAVWGIVAEKLRDLVERSNDVGGCQRDSGFGHQVLSDLLLFPIKCLLLLDQSPKGEVCGNSSRSPERTQRESFEAELQKNECGWFKLFDSVLRISALKSPQPNLFIGGFFHRVMKVMKSSLHEQAQLLPGERERSKLDSSNFTGPCLRFLGDIVAHAMKQAEISNLAMLAISRKRRKTGFGALSSVRVQCIAGMELEDANNLKALLAVASRLLTFSYEKYRCDQMQSSMQESVVRVLGALTSIMQHITSQNDSVLLLQALAQPLSYWFTVNSEAPGSRADKSRQARPLPSSVLEGLSKAWDGLLFCLQTCRPSLVFDSKLLLVQGSALAPAFLHHDDTISNRTLVFWEATYGIKAASLNYPPALVKVFDILKRKVNISLPGWSRRHVVAREMHVHDVPQRFYRPRPSMVRHLKELAEFKSSAGEKRGLAREENQRGSKLVQETKIGLAEKLAVPELEQHAGKQSFPVNCASGSVVNTDEDTTELQGSVNDANLTSLEQQSEFLPTPEGNALIDELMNMDSLSEFNSGRILTNSTSDKSSADSLPIELPTSNDGMQGCTEDSQAVELPIASEVANFVQGPSRPAALEVHTSYEATKLTLCGENENTRTGELMIEKTATNNVNGNGLVALVTPPIASNDIPSVPPKIIMGAERPQGNVNAGVLRVPGISAEGSKRSQAVSNLPRRRKKLKFQDDREAEYAAIPQSQRKKPKRSVSMPTVNLRSSGKLRGGKNWRINSELGKVITARLGIRKIAAKRIKICGNPLSKVVTPPASDVERDVADAHPAEPSTKPWGVQLHACDKQSLKRMRLRSDRTPVNSSSVQENSPSMLTECKDETIEVQAPQPTTNLGPTSKLKESSPFQVRNLNRGLLASTFSAATRIADDSSAQDFVQACRSTRANSHNPRKCRAPKRVPSQDNSSDASLSQSRIGEGSGGEGDADTPGASNETMSPTKSDSTQGVPCSHTRREDIDNGCSRIEVVEPPLIVVCLRSEGPPFQPICSSREHRDGNVPACLLENSQQEPVTNPEVPREGNTEEDVPSCHDDLTPANIISVGFTSDAQKVLHPASFGADRLESQSQPDVEAQPLPSKVRESSEDSGTEPVDKVKALLEREGVQTCHVLSALLESSKWKEMEMTEVIKVDKLLCQLREAVAIQANKGEPFIVMGSLPELDVIVMGSLTELVNSAACSLMKYPIICITRTEVMLLTRERLFKESDDGEA